jgi:hypothetical protein
LTNNWSGRGEYSSKFLEGEHADSFQTVKSQFRVLFCDSGFQWIPAINLWGSLDFKNQI